MNLIEAVQYTLMSRELRVADTDTRKAYYGRLKTREDIALTAFFCPLEQDALLHIVGPDSLKFLQGQTTCDAQTVSPTLSVPGVYCTPKGRVVCDFLLSNLEEGHFVLRMRREIIENSATVFGKYIIFSKAELQADNDDWRCLGIWGADAHNAIADIVDSPATEPYSVARGNGIVVVRLPGNDNAFECYLHTDSAQEIVTKLESAMEPRSEAHWQRLQIRAGMARITRETVEEFVPQILNYDVTDHVNFKKGCYTGQEVVARLHYRGTPKRRTFLANMEGMEAPASGAALFSNGAEQSVGNIVNAIAVDGVVEALAAVTLEAAEGTLSLESQQGAVVSLEAPPYPLEKPENQST